MAVRKSKELPPKEKHTGVFPAGFLGKALGGRKCQSCLASSSFPEAKREERQGGMKQSERFALLLIFALQNKSVCAGGMVCTGLSQKPCSWGSQWDSLAQDSRSCLAHPTQGHPQGSARPGLQQKLLRLGRGETQLHLTLLIPFWRLELGHGE